MYGLIEQDPGRAIYYPTCYLLSLPEEVTYHQVALHPPTGTGTRVPLLITVDRRWAIFKCN